MCIVLYVLMAGRRCWAVLYICNTSTLRILTPLLYLYHPLLYPYIHSLLIAQLLTTTPPYQKQTRQLNLWGFTMSQPNVWSHPHFIKGKLNEVGNIKRVEIKGNGGKKSSSSSPPSSPSRRNKGSSSSPSRRKERKEKGSPARNHKRSLSQTNTTTVASEQPMVTTDLIRATTDSALSTSNLYQQLMTERIKSKLVSELSAIDNSISTGQVYNHETRLVSEMSSGSYNSGVGSYNTAGDYNSGKSTFVFVLYDMNSCVFSMKSRRLVCFYLTLICLYLTALALSYDVLTYVNNHLSFVFGKSLQRASSRL